MTKDNPVQYVQVIKGPQRPNLEHNSVVFTTVRDIGVGAAVGLGVNIVCSLVGKKVPVSTMARSAAKWGLVFGAASAIETSTRNRTIDTVKPYVERLEQEQNNPGFTAR